MPSSEPPSRASIAWQWSVALGTGALGLLIARPQSVLTDPMSCGGLVEALAIWTARLQADLSIAAILGPINIASVPAALTAFWWLARNSTSSTLAATTSTLAFAATPAFARTLALTPAIAVLAIAGAAALTLKYGAAVQTSRHTAAIVLLSFALVAAVVPPLTFAAALVAAAVLLRRGATVASASMTALLVGAAAAVSLLLGSDLPRPDQVSWRSGLGCLVPFTPTASIDQIWTAMGSVFAGLSPLAMAAALLGGFSVSPAILHTRRALVMLTATVLMLMSAGAGDTDPWRTLAPLLVVFWTLAARGMSEAIRALWTTPTRRLAAIAIAALLPLLQFARMHSNALEPRYAARGHDALSANALARVLTVIPPDGVVLVDDTSMDLLARSLARWRRIASRAVVFAPSAPDVVASLVGSRRVYAFPRAQYELQHQGLEMRTDLEPRADGLAEVVSALPCHAVTAQWTSAGAFSINRIAMVTDDRAARGPVIVYVGMAGRHEQHPIDWPSVARRGFNARGYDTQQPADRSQLDQQRTADEVPADAVVLASPFVARLELWRVPDGPTILAIDLGGAPVAIFTRLHASAARRDMRLCPVFTGEITPLR